MTDQRKDEMPDEIWCWTSKCTGGHVWSNSLPSAENMFRISGHTKYTRADLSSPMPDDVAEAIKDLTNDIYMMEVVGGDLHITAPVRMARQIKTLIRAASTPSAEVVTLAQLHEIIPATPLHESMTRDIIADAKRLVALRQTTEVRALRDKIAAWETQAKEAIAIISDGQIGHGDDPIAFLIASHVMLSERLKKPHTGGK